MNRREFVQSSIASAIAAVFMTPRAALASHPLKHPDPRPGITAAKVLADKALPSEKSVRSAYAAARSNPEIFDGIACACGCSDEHRSLLVCYETKQPAGCWSCRDVATLVHNQISKGKSLAEIRAAVDRKFG